MNRSALIIGAGPAGLTAAYEFLHRTDVVPSFSNEATRWAESPAPSTTKVIASTSAATVSSPNPTAS